jgi:DnaJ family protein C protein 2
MERKNAAKRAKKKLQEGARVMRLVELAYKLDPRVRRQRELEKAQKEKIKEERREAARRRDEEQQRIMDEQKKKEEEEAQRQADEAAAKKKENENKKKKLKKARQGLRKLGTEHSVSSEYIEECCEKMDTAVLNETAQQIQADTSKATEIVKAAIDRLNQKKVSDKQQAEETRRAEEARKEQESAWTPEELSSLAKAIIRFPGGSMNRWENIAQYMNNTKTIKEIIAKVKTVKAEVKEGTAKADNLEDSFSRWQKSKSKGTDAGQDGPSVRYDSFETELEASNPPPTSSPAPSPSPAPKKTPSSTASSPATAKASPKVAGAAAKSSTTTPVSSAPSTPAGEFPPEIINWTPEEQKALEAAIKKYPTSHPERWYVAAGFQLSKRSLKSNLYVFVVVGKQLLQRYRASPRKIASRDSNI